MPEPPAPPPTGLDEVERALSVLDGRHPEHERIRRETQAAAEVRGKALQRDLAVAARRRWRRGLLSVVALLVLAGGGAAAWRQAGRARSLRAALDPVEAPFLAHGATELASNELWGRHALDVELPEASCFVAVSTAGRVTARQAAMVAEGAGSVGWCPCGRGHATVTADTEGGLAVLRVDARETGGPLARAWSELRPAAWGNVGDDCAGATLDGWLADHHGPAPSVDARWLESPPSRASLARAGFVVVSGVEPGRPFGVVEPVAESCSLAVAGPADVLALRLAGGARPIVGAHGALAWCSQAAEAVTVWREGSSPVAVLSATAARIGGLLGVRECAEEAATRLGPGATWLPDDDLPWDAGSLLAASTLAQITRAPLPGEPGPASARTSGVWALALAPDGRATSETADRVVACDPPLHADDMPPATVCASAGPMAWWHRGDGRVGGAQAPLPFWLALLEPHHEVDAIARIPELLSLARRLARAGFEPTVLEGVTELPDGVRVVGRAGEDQVVAVGLGPRPPWAFPYTDGVAWDLGDPPRMVPIAPGKPVKLTSSPRSDAPLEKRRTVVFRHVTRP